MSNLSEKELSSLGDLLSSEQLLVKKFNMLAQTTQDLALRGKLLDIANKHQQHFDMLYSQL